MKTPPPHTRRTLWTVATLLACLCVPGNTLAQTEDALPTLAEVTKTLDDLYRAKSSHATMTMDIKTKHFQRSLTIETWSRGKDLSLMVIRAPARERGTATLRNGDGLWNYAPRSDRLMRIPSSMLSESWMGSHFTNDDLVRESSYADDFDSTLSWQGNGDAKRLVLTMVPKPDAPVVWTKVVQTLLPGTWIPTRAEYYDGDKIIRTLHFKSIKSFDGRPIPSILEVIPTDAPEEITRVTYEKMAFNPSLEANLFTARGLKRAAGRR